MNGAVQGVATTVASTPVKNEPASPSLRVRLSPAPVSDPPSSNTPDRFSPSARNSAISASTKPGDWN